MRQSGPGKGNYLKRRHAQQSSVAAYLGLSSLCQGLNKVMWLCRVRGMLLDPGLKAVSPEDLQAWLKHMCNVHHCWLSNAAQACVNQSDCPACLLHDVHMLQSSLHCQCIC